MAKRNIWDDIGAGLLAFGNNLTSGMNAAREQAWLERKFAADQEQRDLDRQMRMGQLADMAYQRQFQREQSIGKASDEYEAARRQWEQTRGIAGEDLAGPAPSQPYILRNSGLMGGSPNSNQTTSAVQTMRPMFGPTSDSGGAIQPSSSPLPGGNKTYANLGDYIFKYESGNDPSSVSPDAGGFSYGLNQTNYSPARGNTSAIPKFVNQYGYTPWFTDAPGTPTFNKQWQAYGKDNPEFAAAQRDFAKTEFYDPVAQYAASKGIDTGNKGIQEALLGIGNAHGPETAKRIIDRVAAANPSGTTDPVQFLGALYAERMKPGDGSALAYWRSSSPEVQTSVKNRLASEKNDVLSLAQAGQAPTAADQQIMDIANSGQETPLAGSTPPPWSQGTNLAQAGQPSMTDIGKASAQSIAQNGPRDLRWWVNNASDADLAKLSVVKPDIAKTIFEIRKRNEPPNDIKEFNAFAGMTPEQKQQFTEYKRLSKPETNVNIDGGKKFQQTLGELWAKDYQKMFDDASNAQDIRNNIQAAKQIMSGGLQTGALEPAKAQVSALAQSFGIDPNKLGLPNAADAQKFNAVVMKNLLSELVAQKGPQTEGDASRALKTFAQLGNTPEANQFALDYADAVAQRKQDMADHVYQVGRDKYEGDSFKAKSDWQKKINGTPLFAVSQQTGKPVTYYQFRDNAQANGLPAEEIDKAWQQFAGKK